MPGFVVPNIMDWVKVTMTSATFFSNCLFDEKAKLVVAQLEAYVWAFSLHKSIKAMANTKASQHKQPPPASSGGHVAKPSPRESLPAKCNLFKNGSH